VPLTKVQIKMEPQNAVVIVIVREQEPAQAVIALDPVDVIVLNQFSCAMGVQVILDKVCLKA